ncbi:MAG: hypothetical protein ACYC26_05995 [Phycisphaerales bacterium]
MTFKRMAVGIGLILLVAVAATLFIQSDVFHRRNLPLYNCSLWFDRTQQSTPQAYSPDEPIMATCELNRRNSSTPPPTMAYQFADPVSRRHWLTLDVTDPKGLAWRWQRQITEDEARAEEARFRQSQYNGIRLTFDLRQWAPPNFVWKTGEYQLVVRIRAATEEDHSLTSHVFINQVPPDAYHHAYPPLLTGELEANGSAFDPGGVITLRGYLKNHSDQPVMVYTRQPFRMASLIAEGNDTFPMTRPTGPVRLSHFTKLEPNQRVLLFEESFVAGVADPDWSVGCRTEWFPQPFGLSFPRHIRFTYQFTGEFPHDRQPEVGIAADTVNSNQVAIEVTRPRTVDFKLR